MATCANPHNVFKGPNSVVNFFDPNSQAPLPLVEIPDRLNPLRQDGVRIYAKLLTALPAQNVKMLPALNMLQHAPSASNKSIVEASSGSTALSLAMCARVLWGNEDTTAYVTNKKHPSSLRMLRFFGCKVSLYGGLAQQEPVDPKGIMSRLRKQAKYDPGVIYPGQYDNDLNWQSHDRWTGPQIVCQLPEVNVFATTVGTGGCISGTGVHLKRYNPSVKVIGVCNVFGDPTPGPRHFPGFESSSFPWRETIDAFEDVKSVDSYTTSMRLSREGIVCGPSSGEALHGLFQYLNRVKLAGKLHDLADSRTGEINCVFICCDLPYQYLDIYFEKCPVECFPSIGNEVLLNCDQDKYDERWELGAGDAARFLMQGSSRAKLSNVPICKERTCRNACRNACQQNPSSPVILDLRQQKDFLIGHIRGSLSSPLAGLSASTEDIFGDASAICMHWGNLKRKLDIEETRFSSDRDVEILVIDYDGDAARMAVAMLRGRGYETAFSLKGGSTTAFTAASTKSQAPNKKSAACSTRVRAKKLGVSAA